MKRQSQSLVNRQRFRPPKIRIPQNGQYCACCELGIKKPGVPILTDFLFRGLLLQPFRPARRRPDAFRRRIPDGDGRNRQWPFDGPAQEIFRLRSRCGGGLRAQNYRSPSRRQLHPLRTLSKNRPRRRGCPQSWNLGQSQPIFISEARFFPLRTPGLFG